MCCRTTIRPLSIEIARSVLLIGQFKQADDRFWRREVIEEEAAVLAEMTNDSFMLRIEPTIQVVEHHHGKRITAGIYFEIAAKYAEKVSGEVTQHANIMGCYEAGITSRLLASYPSIPLTFDRICNGFQAEFGLVEGTPQ